MRRRILKSYYTYSQHQKQQAVPCLYITPGCNGIGKATTSFTILPEVLKCRESVNPDEIAKGLSPFNAGGIAVTVEASRIMYKRIKKLVGAGKTFAMGTTLAIRSIVNPIQGAQKESYYITLFYSWLNTLGLAMERIEMRVAAGDHDIPETTIRRRYGVGIHNSFELYLPISGHWVITDNSISPTEMITKRFKNDKEETYNLDVFTKPEHHE